MVKRAAWVEVPPLMLADGPSPLHRQLADGLRSAIGKGALPAGARLPATRQLAVALGVSRNTVLTAYDELLADGLLEGRVGAGSYVAAGAGPLAFSDVDGNRLFLWRAI